ncbi:MAG: aminodeoxychorismate synthase component I [Planctomycetaceae bacterium]
MSQLVQELNPVPSVPELLVRFRDEAQVLLLDSSRQDQRGRYSYLMANPVRSFVIEKPEYGQSPFADVAAELANWTTDVAAGLPPFQGGAAGMLSYELGQCWERLPHAPHNELDMPAAVVGLYAWVITWDNHQNKAWLIAREQANQCDVQHVLELLKEDQATPDPLEFDSSRREMAPLQHAVPGYPQVASNFSRDSYLQSVQRVIDYIVAGDIFQANLSQRLVAPTDEHPVSLYNRLRQTNPAPFAGYLQHDDWAVLSSSPERFLQLSEGVVRTRPIKGTRQRKGEPLIDLMRRDELRESRKDRAENVMIVDLLRNDLSRVCRPGTVQVPELCTIETFETVSHLVSEVTGELEPGRQFWDVLAAAFPGGSITGAPKVRAMEIITELEQVARGPYCGSFFYCGPDGTADSNILIRTMTARGGWLQFPVGGGIVAQSDPAQEYDETMHKAQGMLRALERTPKP